METKKRQAVQRLIKQEKVFFIFCGYTRMPFVECDEETKDDEISLFDKEDDAKTYSDQLNEEGNMTMPGNVPNKSFLSFFAGLIPMGVNCVRYQEENGEVYQIQVNEIVHRSADDKDAKDEERVENPALHLTTLYLRQAMGRSQGEEPTQEILDLDEEVLAHFNKSTFLMPLQEDYQMPLLKQKSGKIFQPLFTDASEYKKFDREGKYKPYRVEAKNLQKVLTKEADGLVINPMGVNLFLNVETNEKPG